MPKVKVMNDGRVMTEEELSHEARVQMALSELDPKSSNRTRVHNTPRPGSQSGQVTRQGAVATSRRRQ